MRNIPYILASIALLFASVSYSHETEDKELVSPTELALKSDAYKIIDIRQPEEFTKGHVPGAYSIPLKEISEIQLERRGLVETDQIVLYGLSETPAKKAKMLLDIIGYSNVRILAGGFTHWLEDGQAAELGNPEGIAEPGKVTSTGSDLVVIPQNYDFGVISKVGGVVKTTFQVENSSTQEVSITEITTSCGCTTAVIDETAIPSGGSQQLTVFFDPNFHKEPEGKFSRTVFLQTSENKEILAKVEVEIED